MRKEKVQIPEPLDQKQRELLKEIAHFSYDVTRKSNIQGSTERIHMMTEIMYQIGLQVIGNLSIGLHNITMSALDQMQREDMEEEMK